jgi:hypothetical protein
MCGTDSVFSTFISKIAYFNGKVNQYFDIDEKVWKSDPDRSSGSSINKLTYCQKWWPQTTSYVGGTRETISFKTAYGTTLTRSGHVSKCVRGLRTCTIDGCEATQVTNSNKEKANSINGNIDQEVQVICSLGYEGGGAALCGKNGLFNTLTCNPKPCTPTQVANSNKAVENSIQGM